MVMALDLPQQRWRAPTVLYLSNAGDNAGEVVDAGERDDVNAGVGLDAATDELGNEAHHPKQVHLVKYIRILYIYAQPNSFFIQMIKGDQSTVS